MPSLFGQRLPTRPYDQMRPPTPACIHCMYSCIRLQTCPFPARPEPSPTNWSVPAYGTTMHTTRSARSSTLHGHTPVECTPKCEGLATTLTRGLYCQTSKP